MAYFIEVPKFTDARGSLCVLEDILPFEIKRIFYIFDVLGKRGKHRHKKTKQALITLGGSCKVYVNNGSQEKTFILNESDKCLIIEPEDWHTMDDFLESTTLLVLASENYDVDDYIHEPYV